MTKPIWTPSQNRMIESNLYQYMQRMSRRFQKQFSNYDALYQWSIDSIDDFWESIWDEAGIISSEKYVSIRHGNNMFGTKWFESAQLNFAENLLKYTDSHTAIISKSESRTTSTITYSELHEQVARCAKGLKTLGVTKNDRVAAFIPNIVEAVIAMLAVTSIGAIWSSCSPDFGLQGVLDRFSQIQPKVLLTANGYTYNGKTFDSLERVATIKERIPSIKTVIIIPLIEQTISTSISGSTDWDQLLHNQATTIDFEQLPFDHPVYIMYSSGTTGIPKCIVHGAGGTLLQHYKEHVLHTDINRSDVVTYFTTCGWMMWNWLISVLQTGATMYLFDGSPSYPNINILWNAIETNRITHFGTSPKFLSSCENTSIKPYEEVDLSSLKTILSTGAPLTDNNFDYVYNNIKQDVQLSSISGGTDILSCFMLGCPLLPVYKGEIQCRGLGMKVEAYDPQGQPLLEQVGELVCTAPFPSMPVSFYNDPDNLKYKSAYFDLYQDIWAHGDFIKITKHGGIVVSGRSDATLNPGGVRIGTAEIYAPVEEMEEINDSIVVAQRYNNDVRILLFVQLHEQYILTDELRQKIKARIRQRQTPRHVPAVILAVNSIPYTISGKKVEIAVTRTIHGETVPNKDALMNPESLQQYEKLAIGLTDQK